MKTKKLFFVFILCAAFACLVNPGTSFANQKEKPKELPILQQWSGDYPVSELRRLPENLRTSSVGFLANAETFAGVWQAFQPNEKIPDVDFKSNLVVFTRNTDFYNRTSIMKVTLQKGAADVIAMETMSALPIEDKAAMAMAVIPRAGVRFIRAGQNLIPVKVEASHQEASAADPLQASYRIERQEVHLINGKAEAEAAPGSAIKVKTSVFGQAVFGDINGDGNKDAALFLVHQPGGSGTFYYVAAALNTNSGFRGTNAVLLGDRIAPQTIEIRDSIVIANYADRRPEESMSTPPSVGMSIRLVVKSGELITLHPLGKGN
ncbi:MAG: hypothetical protein GY774_04490 [Planctomycetes bacterium]|nr:hypothetical protein [Planctomycetota bacterium]